MNATMERDAAQESKQYQVADLLVDAGRQRITRAGVEIPLPKLSFDLLLALIRAAPDVVSIDELMARVWPGLVVSPETVSQRVKLLRDALGDDPREPRYICGLRGRGYRLAADVVPLGTRPNDAHSAAVGHIGMPPPRRVRTRFVLGTLAALVVLGLAGSLLLTTLRPQPAPVSFPSTVKVVGLPPRTVAVLPFENLSRDPVNDYLALGMAEMVLNRLASVSEITVIARSSSFAFRAARMDAREIGRRLDARYLVEGGVQRQGDRLRVTARLIDAQNGSQVKSLHFDRGLAHIFSIQDEIADKVAAALEASLASVVVTRTETAGSANLDAWLTYLQGRALLEQWTVSGAQQAVQRFRKAIDLDPKFAAAYVALADAQMFSAWRSGRVLDEKRPSFPLVHQLSPLIEKALALDPTLGAAYIWRAMWSDETPEQIEADLRRGVELDPGNARGLMELSSFMLDTGRPEAARRMLDRALAIDPLSARARYLKALDFTDTPLAQEQALLEVLKIDPNFTSALMRLGQRRWKIYGQFAEGVKLAERAIAIDPQMPWSRTAAYIMYVDMGDLAAAQDVIGPVEGFAKARFQIFQFLGDWRRAGEAVYEVPDPMRGSDNWNDAEAVRDLALHTGDYRRAIRFIQSQWQLGEPRKLTSLNVARAVPLAHLLKQSGQSEASARLLEDILAQLDSDEPKPPWLPPTGRIRANALALRGDRDAALAELAEAFRSGSHYLWWYTIERDPLYANMRSDPRFQAIAADTRAHAAQQRVLLEQMRRKGEVPYRPSSTATATHERTEPPGPDR